MTTIELMNALPPQLSYLGTYYNLAWKVNESDSRVVQLGYRDSEYNYLGIDGYYFYIESEKHYATLTLLRNILYYADTVLSHIWMQDTNFYQQLIEVLNQNESLLSDVCSKLGWGDNTLNVVDNNILHENY